MRYFKYKNVDSAVKKARCAVYGELTSEKKRVIRKNQLLSAISVVVFVCVLFACDGFGIWVTEMIPLPENGFLKFLSRIGDFAIKGVAFIVGLILGVCAVIPVLRKRDTISPDIERSIRAKACDYLRQYYGLQDPCIVTKCYESSEKRFTNKDVCIFVAGEELRITTNLKYGFYHTRNDLGCYAFRADEITLKKVQEEKLLIAELRAGETVFLLGYRAKGFIQRNFLSPESV